MAYYRHSQFRSTRVTGADGADPRHNLAFNEQGGTRGAHPIGSHTTKHLGKPHLVLFPGETTNSAGVTVGHIYVVGGHGESYEAAGGPAQKKHRAEGGSWAGMTPIGHFVLGQKHHHTSKFWPSSVIPWGASLRQREDGEFEYQAGKDWKLATGPKGDVTLAELGFRARGKREKALSRSEREKAISEVHDFFAHYVVGRKLTTWFGNDFGEWSWQLIYHGKGTQFYVHTTPGNEISSSEGTPFELTQSHGCIHIRPPDRDKMMDLGYLHAGMEFEVRPYGKKGPP